MSIHIGAKQGDIAETILLPGDPLRAKYIAETFLEDVTQFNEVRNMFGFTGTYKGKRISVMGTGMGIPSISIYVHELMRDYGVKNLIRVGTCGAIKEDINVRDLIIAQSASTDSSQNTKLFNNISYAPTSDFELLASAYNEATKRGTNAIVGNVFTADSFYDEKGNIEQLAEYGVLALEMESSALFTIAKKYNARALSILTVSDHVITGEETSAMERQTTFNEMIEIALDAALPFAESL
ncbi:MULTISPECIES: purine-nucleoside phosphorylase [Nosocomiicoccus]|uniref:Purine nucleoside phosphorylase DeoD-type n=1 Tax=Nosocomiicoccus massiliensis TaxID=1232430 RepID=A0AAF0YIM4_9STAP|nr:MULTISPECIES: purine-nucleoside phosphorylase [Nosocomiicoccus]MDK6862728.1 purine-nucleoside phosphorylase [Nosocomiicoccus ampullae]OFL46157.1 purine nucleoside phosphorylase DeoD-type [Nosocomiicoccus sp. HMSC067E10]OFO55411.1 purine nucleoside phosphorylase DeoD-type [Nosocomiicoccus sp. HMSC059G07]OFS64277.1 purine nucleoside phosphorylase DeoD-type [Nosocomiicoccus sp. HMSC09A07]WOS96568.1 purine-nucleoside phosphorylase [Nosocomiicoccus massiliensis]